MISSPGVYRIVNSINGKEYIGCTSNIRRRWGEHRRRLNQGTSHCHKLQNAVRKYGMKNFKFEIILLCEEESLDYYEVNLIKASGSLSNGYNISEGGRGGLGPKHSDYQKKKWSEMRKGVRPTSQAIEASMKANKKTVIQLNTNLEYLSRFSSIKEAACFTNSDSSCISRASRGALRNTNYHNGFYWIREDLLNDSLSLSEQIKKSSELPPVRPVMKLDSETGEVLQKFKSISEAESQGFTGPSISKVASGKAKVHKGFSWAYLTPPKGKQKWLI